MEDTVQLGDSTIRLVKGDITDLDIEAFVYYARPDLILGSGFGTAIAMRGGPSVQEELNKIGSASLTDAVVTAAGDMKASHIVHAVGPAFQEEDLETKLVATIRNALEQAESRGIKAIAFPLMGTGFYGVPLETSAELTVGTISQYLSRGSAIKEVVICALDKREYIPVAAQLKAQSVA